MACRCAPSLVDLRNELNALWPNRDRASDGCCASTEHTAQNPKSDHEPASDGFAHALDIDEDLAVGVDLEWLWRSFMADPDPRVKYLIYEGRIVWPNSTTNRNPRPYTGINAHKLHMHVSITLEAGTVRKPWHITERYVQNAPPLPVPTPPAPPEDPMSRYYTDAGSPVTLDMDHVLDRGNGSVWAFSSDGKGIYALGLADFSDDDVAVFRANFGNRTVGYLCGLLVTAEDVRVDAGPYGVVVVATDGAWYKIDQFQPRAGATAPPPPAGGAWLSDEQLGTLRASQTHAQVAADGIGSVLSPVPPA